MLGDISYIKLLFNSRVNIVFTFTLPPTNTFIALEDVKVKNDHRSKFSNLSNWKEEA